RFDSGGCLWHTRETMTLDKALTNFLTSLRARNTSALTQQAYATDVRQFISWFGETSVLSQEIGSVTKTDLIEYLSYLASLGRSGVTRARKLASLREFFSYLQEQTLIPVSPAASVAIPKKERKAQTFLRPEEYSRLLSVAGANPRDFAILQLFLQTGIRVSE